MSKTCPQCGGRGFTDTLAKHPLDIVENKPTLKSRLTVAHMKCFTCNGTGTQPTIENKDGDWHGMYGEPEETKLYTEPPISTQKEAKFVQSYVNKAGEFGEDTDYCVPLSTIIARIQALEKDS